jgi:carbon monoxide dehydrogenase subunit G
VWAYLVDPRRVVRCLPGAELTEVVDERTFLGKVKVKVGPVTVAYQGKVTLVELDLAGQRVRMAGEGRETTGSGAARMNMESRLVALPSGETEVTVVAEVDIAGRLMQLGRGMIEQVSHQLFQQFSACVRATLEAEQAAVSGGASAASPPPQEAGPVRAIPLILTTLWAALAGFLRRLFGRKRV